MDACFRGGVDQDLMDDAGLEVEGDTLCSSCHSGYVTMWTDAVSRDMNAGAVASYDNRHGCLSGELHGSGYASWSSRWRGVWQQVARTRSLSLVAATPRCGSRGLLLVVVLLGASW